MPNRIIRDGILESHAINRLSPEAELFYRRLLSIVDDFGRYEWDAQKLRLRAMGLRYDWADLDRVNGWMAECAKEVVKVYEVGGILYGQLEKWKDKPRAAKSKFPSYEESTTYREIAMQMQADAKQVQADDSRCKQMPPYSNSNALSKSLSLSNPVIDFPKTQSTSNEDDLVSEIATNLRKRHPNPVKMLDEEIIRQLISIQKPTETLLELARAVDGNHLALCRLDASMGGWRGKEPQFIPTLRKWLSTSARDPTEKSPVPTQQDLKAQEWVG